MLEFNNLPEGLIVKPSTVFSNNTEYEIFLDNFCHACRNHVETEDGFCAMPVNGGCVIENGLEDARFDTASWPKDDIVEIWDGERCLNWYYCKKYVAAPDPEDEADGGTEEDDNYIEGQISWIDITA